MQSIEQTLSILLEEFKQNLPNTEGSMTRSISFPEVSNMINVAIGVRRSGKTYLIYQKIRELPQQGVSFEQILFINFEDDRLLPVDQTRLAQLLDTFYTMCPQNHDRKCYFFLDEIQNVENWPLVIRRFYDSKNVQIFLTGSSAKLLSKEIATSLRGRCISTQVFPYSFQEYWKAHHISKPHPPIGKKITDQFYQHFQNYLMMGGFPAIQDMNKNDTLTVLQTYVDTVVFRDIIERHNIKNIQAIKYLIKTLIKNPSAPFTVNKFHKDIRSQGLKVNRDSIYEYMNYIEDAFLAFSVPLFTQSIRKMQVNPKKICIVDNGLIYVNQLRISSNFGSLFKNQIYLDLRRKGKKVFYYLTKEGYEIDFVVESLNGTFELLQVVWDMSDHKTLEREMRALKQAEQELGVKGRIISPEEYILDSFK